MSRHQRPSTVHPVLMTVLVLITAFGAALIQGCAEEVPPIASARQITQRWELIGGTRALGEVGDFLLENDQIRVIIQGPGYSRGFGVFGGSLIDADRRRPSEEGGSGGGTGHDNFAELFPALFLQAANAQSVEVLSDGSDGGAAQIRVIGMADDFLTMAGFLNRAALGSHEDYNDRDSEQNIMYETLYELLPGRSYVTIRFRVHNISDDPLLFPGFPYEIETMLRLLGLDMEGFTIPVADVVLFGKACSPWAPGAGFNLEFTLRDAYTSDVEWPALPGFVTDWIASRSNDSVSYGLIVEPSESNYAYNKRESYENAETTVTQSSMLIPFEASSFLGIFYNNAPDTLEPGDYFELTRHFIVGTGDVGSVLNIINDIQGVPVGHLGGMVLDAVTGQPAEDARVLVYQRREDGSHRIYSEYDVREGGSFSGTLQPGSYSLRTVGHGRPLSDFVDVDIQRDQTTTRILAANAPGRIVVNVVDNFGQPLPARATAVGWVPPERANVDTRTFLFDLDAGESWRYTDMVPDDPDDPSTMRYIEEVEPTLDGFAELLVRPGHYEIFTSRGPEYDLVSVVVDVGPGETVTVASTLEHVVDTTGWIAGDLHLHSVNSIDANTNLDRRVRMLAAEGVEWAVSTDHNYITDYAPTIAQNHLEPWMISSVGIELTTLESGHFNGYPINYEVGHITHGSFEWSSRPPGEIFAELHAMGTYGPENTIVQVNHGRDTILGYMNQYRIDGLSTQYIEPSIIDQFMANEGPAFYDEDGNTTWSWDFDTFEILNGKRFDLIHHYRVPEVLPDGEIPERIPPAGTILLDSDGQVAYPGALDDWYNFLNLGHRFIGVGVSDSHQDYEEPGYARSLIYVGEDAPQAVNELDLVHGLQRRRVVCTNGPLVDFWVNDPVTGAMGQTLTDGDGTISLAVHLTAAPWISVGRMNLIRNGLVVRSVEVDEDQDLAAQPLDQVFDVPLATDEEGTPIDSWFAVEVIGYRSYFPVVRPLEIPPLSISDAISGLAGAFGLESGEYGDLRPSQVHIVTAYAHTNPVWVTTSDHEFQAPGLPPLAMRNAEGADPGINVNPYGRSFIPGWVPQGDLVRPVGWASPMEEARPGVFQRNPGDLYDIRGIFRVFAHE